MTSQVARKYEDTNEGMFNNHMTDDGMILRRLATIHNTSAERAVTCEVHSDKMCACVRTVRCSLCTVRVSTISRGYKSIFLSTRLRMSDF